MGQWKKVVDKTEFFVVGNSKIDNSGYAYVLILKSFAYNGTHSLKQYLILI